MEENVARHSSMSAEELVRACAESNDNAAWDEFVSRFNKPITLSVIRVAHQWGEFAREVVDDLVQEIYLKLCTDRCRLLLDFATRHPEAILGYIKTTAANAARDHFKSYFSQKRGSGRTNESLEGVDPAGGNEAFGSPSAIEHEVLLRQIEAILPTCSPESERERNRLIFWLYYRQGMTAKAIASLAVIGLSAKGVESVIVRLTRLLREHIVKVRSEPKEQSDPDEKGFRPAESF
jgi:RNA polymerase sigma-70 factor (ECF subfamily)